MIKTKTIKSVGGSSSTEDGKFAAFALQDIQDNEFFLIIPFEWILQFIQRAVESYTKCANIQNAEDEIPLVELSSWATGTLKDAPESNIITLSMGFASGGAISYWMPQKMADALQQELSRVMVDQKQKALLVRQPN